MCAFCRSLFVLLYCFLWTLCCLFFCDIQILDHPFGIVNSSFFMKWLKDWNSFTCTKKALTWWFVFLQNIEVSFVVLVAIYGLSSIMDRRWVTDGLWNVSEAGSNIKRTFDFLAIGLLVLMPIIVLNRFMGIGAVFKRWKKVFYLVI